MSLGYKVWRYVEREYRVPDDLPIYRYELDQYEANEKSLNAILSGLTNSVFVRFMQCETAKQVWEKKCLQMSIQSQTIQTSDIQMIV